MSDTVNKKFSGWSVLVGCFLLSFFVVGVISNTASLFMAPICTEFGFESAQYSIINTCSSIAMAVGAMWLAPRMQKGSMKKIMLVCAIVAGLGYAAMGLCSQLWQFYLAFTVCNLGMSGLSNLPIAMMVTCWFDDKRSLAMSLAFCGSGLGGAVWAQVFAKIIASSGWRTAYFIGAGIALAAALLIVLFLVKKHPAEFGQTAYVSDQPAKTTDKKPAKSADTWKGIDKKTAMKSGPFVLLVLDMFLIGCLAAGVATHSIYYMIGNGWEMSAASGVLSVFSLMAIPSLILGGVLFEKLGVKGGTAFSGVCAIIGLVGLMLCENHVFGYVYAVGFALSTIMPRLLPPTLTSTVFGVKDYAPIYSVLNAIFMAGAALGAVITGAVSQAAGGYTPAWIMYIVFCVAIFLLTCAAVAGGRKLREKYPDGTSAN